MFTQPVPSPAAAPTPASTVSPSRSSRLRGLSYLRNYTHSHLLSRDASGSSASGTGTGTTTTSTSTTGTTTPRQQSGLTRSVSYTPGALPTHSSSSSANRLSLVSSTPEPSRPSRQTETIPETTTEAPAATAAAAAQTSTDPTAEATPDPDHTVTAAMRTTTENAAVAGPSAAPPAPDAAPSIRFSSYFDQRASRPSLTFSAITRTLPGGTEVIRVGRYSERDSQPLASVTGNQPSAAPVGFKSKVVSRRHCEFWYENGKWFIKDVKSSSGTFLNHIRLSPPSQESKAFPVNDGDIVQLGIDFKGGEEMIFRCVKMRLELNRGWQNKPNTFKYVHPKHLR